MAAVDETPHPSGPAFESLCGRLGCAHIFKYGGTNPFQDLAVLVARHTPHCIAHIISATHECETGSMRRRFTSRSSRSTTDIHSRDCDAGAAAFPDSYAGAQASIDDLYASEEEMWLDVPDFERAVSIESMSAATTLCTFAAAAYHTEGQAHDFDTVVASTHSSIIVSSQRRRSAADIDIDTADMEVDTQEMLDSSDGTFSVNVSVNSRAPTKRRKKAASPSTKPKPRRTKQVPAPTTATVPPTLPRKKKGARTEAQRRAVLTNDPWILRVGPQSVLCRGCKNTIRLDGRSRYYPGLWEKHRLRCEGVKQGRSVGRLLALDERVLDGHRG